MRQSPLPRRRLLCLGAVSGVALAHVFSAVYEVPGGGRELALGEARYGWHHVAALGGVAGALAVFGALQRGIHTRAGRSRPSTPVLPDVRLVAVLQMLLFGGNEVAERLLTREPIVDLVHSRFFLLGLLVQVCAAAVVVALLRAAEHVAARLSFGSRLAASDPCQRLRERASSPFAAVAAQRPDCRGPPSRHLSFGT